MPAIHLLARKADQTPNDFRHLGDGMHLSGWWELTEEQAAKLVGGQLFLHDTKRAPSWYGGEIVEWRRGEAGTLEASRVCFLFRGSSEGRGHAWDWGGKPQHTRAELSIVD